MSVDLRGQRVLIVEDEGVVAMMLEDLLAEAGCAVRVALTLDEALVAAGDGAYDVAVLDVNLNGRESYPAAEILRRRGVPLVFSSGYGGAALKGEFLGLPTLQKPFRRDALLAAVGAALGATHTA